MSLSPPMQPHTTASDPHVSLLSSSCLDFLLIELVPLAHRTTIACDSPAALPASPQDSVSHTTFAASASAAHIPSTTSTTTTTATATTNHTNTTIAAGNGAGGYAHNANANSNANAIAATAHGGSVASAPRRLDDEEHLDAVHYRLESQGYRVGQGLVERFSRDRPRFNDTLEVIKFICKDLWALVFGKNIDNLKTNHRGVYVLTDNLFRPFSRMSTETGSQAIVRAQPFLWFPCGIVRGALAALGINATVQAETTELPGAVFQIKTIPFKP